MDKIQVGENVWVKPNRGCAMPNKGSRYWVIISCGEPSSITWLNDYCDRALLNSGNFFPTREAAEAAIIKPADPTPITYDQWVEAERRFVYSIAAYGDIVSWEVPSNAPRFVFATNLCWFTKESAKAWLDKWNAEHGVKE